MEVEWDGAQTERRVHSTFVRLRQKDCCRAPLPRFQVEADKTSRLDTHRQLSVAARQALQFGQPLGADGARLRHEFG